MDCHSAKKIHGQIKIWSCPIIAFYENGDEKHELPEFTLSECDTYAKFLSQQHGIECVGVFMHISETNIPHLYSYYNGEKGRGF